MAMRRQGLNDEQKPRPRERLASKRRALGLSQEQVAQGIRVDPSTYGRCERGETTLKFNRWPAIARFFTEVAADQGLDVIYTPEEVAVWMTANGSDGDQGVQLVPEWLTTYIKMEQGAKRVDASESHVAHAMLQTEDYAAALIAGSDYVWRSGGGVERLVALRIRRQAVLMRDTNPLELHLVLSEAALRLVVGSDEVMRTQLAHLADMAEQHDNITVRILPFRAGPHPAMRGEFIFLTFPGQTAPSLVYLEPYIGGASYIETRNEIDYFTSIYERLQGMALEPAESVDFIRRTAKDLYDA